MGLQKHLKGVEARTQILQKIQEFKAAYASELSPSNIADLRSSINEFAQIPIPAAATPQYQQGPYTAPTFIKPQYQPVYDSAGKIIRYEPIPAATTPYQLDPYGSTINSEGASLGSSGSSGSMLPSSGYTITPSTWGGYFPSSTTTYSSSGGNPSYYLFDSGGSLVPYYSSDSSYANSWQYGGSTTPYYSSGNTWEGGSSSFPSYANSAQYDAYNVLPSASSTYGLGPINPLSPGNYANSGQYGGGSNLYDPFYYTGQTFTTNLLDGNYDLITLGDESDTWFGNFVSIPTSTKGTWDTIKNGVVQAAVFAAKTAATAALGPIATAGINIIEFASDTFGVDASDPVTFSGLLAPWVDDVDTWGGGTQKVDVISVPLNVAIGKTVIDWLSRAGVVYNTGMDVLGKGIEMGVAGLKGMLNGQIPSGDCEDFQQRWNEFADASTTFGNTVNAFIRNAATGVIDHAITFFQNLVTGEWSMASNEKYQKTGVISKPGGNLPAEVAAGDFITSAAQTIYNAVSGAATAIFNTFFPTAPTVTPSSFIGPVSPYGTDSTSGSSYSDFFMPPATFGEDLFIGPVSPYGPSSVNPSNSEFFMPPTPSWENYSATKEIVSSRNVKLLSMPWDSSSKGLKFKVNTYEDGTTGLAPGQRIPYGNVTLVPSSDGQRLINEDNNEPFVTRENFKMRTNGPDGKTMSENNVTLEAWAIDINENKVLCEVTRSDGSIYGLKAGTAGDTGKTGGVSSIPGNINSNGLHLEQTADGKGHMITLMNDSSRLAVELSLGQDTYNPLPFAPGSRNINLAVGYNLNKEVVIGQSARVDVFDSGSIQFANGAQVKLLNRSNLIATYDNALNSKGEVKYSEGIPVTARSYDSDQTSTGRWGLSYGSDLEHVTANVDLNGRVSFTDMQSGVSYKGKSIDVTVGNNGTTLIADKYIDRAIGVEWAYPVSANGETGTAKVSMKIAGATIEGGVVGAIYESDRKLMQFGGGKPGEGLDLPKWLVSEHITIGGDIGKASSITLDHALSSLVFVNQTLMPTCEGSNHLTFEKGTRYQNQEMLNEVSGISVGAKGTFNIPSGTQYKYTNQEHFELTGTYKEQNGIKVAMAIPDPGQASRLMNVSMPYSSETAQVYVGTDAQGVFKYDSTKEHGSSYGDELLISNDGRELTTETGTIYKADKVALTYSTQDGQTHITHTAEDLSIEVNSLLAEGGIKGGVVGITDHKFQWDEPAKKPQLPQLTQDSTNNSMENLNSQLLTFGIDGIKLLGDDSRLAFIQTADGKTNLVPLTPNTPQDKMHTYENGYKIQNQEIIWDNAQGYVDSKGVVQFPHKDNNGAINTAYRFDLGSNHTLEYDADTFKFNCGTAVTAKEVTLTVGVSHGINNIQATTSENGVWETRKIGNLESGKVDYGLFAVEQQDRNGRSIGLRNGPNVLGAGWTDESLMKYADRLTEAANKISLPHYDPLYPSVVASSFKGVADTDFVAEIRENGRTTGMMQIYAGMDGDGNSYIKPYTITGVRNDGSVKTTNLNHSFDENGDPIGGISVKDGRVWSNYLATTTDSDRTIAGKIREGAEYKSVAPYFKDQAGNRVTDLQNRFTYATGGNDKQRVSGGVWINGHNIIFKDVSQILHNSTKSDGSFENYIITSEQSALKGTKATSNKMQTWDKDYSAEWKRRGKNNIRSSGGSEMSLTAPIGLAQVLFGAAYDAVTDDTYFDIDLTPANIGYETKACITGTSLGRRDSNGNLHTGSVTFKFDSNHEINDMSIEAFQSAINTLPIDAPIDQRVAHANIRVADVLDSYERLGTIVMSDIAYKTTNSDMTAVEFLWGQSHSRDLKPTGFTKNGEAVSPITRITGKKWDYVEQVLTGLQKSIANSENANALRMNWVKGDGPVPVINFAGMYQGMQAKFYAGQGESGIEQSRINTATGEQNGILIDTFLHRDGGNDIAEMRKSYDAQGEFINSESWARLTESKQPGVIKGESMFGGRNVDVHALEDRLRIEFKDVDAGNPFPVNIPGTDFDMGRTKQFNLVSNERGRLVPENKMLFIDEEGGWYSLRADSVEISGGAMSVLTGAMEFIYGASVKADIGIWHETTHQGGGDVPGESFSFRYSAGGEVSDGKIAIKEGCFVKVLNRTTVRNSSNDAFVYTNIEKASSEGLVMGRPDMVSAEKLRATFTKQRNYISDTKNSEDHKLDTALDRGNFTSAIHALGRIREQVEIEAIVAKAREQITQPVQESSGVSHVYANLMEEMGAGQIGVDGKLFVFSDAAQRIRSLVDSDPGAMKRIQQASQYFESGYGFMKRNVYDTVWYKTFGKEMLFDDVYYQEAIVIAASPFVATALVVATVPTIAGMGLWVGVSGGTSVAMDIYAGRDIDWNEAIAQGLQGAFLAGAFKGLAIVGSGLMNGFNITTRGGKILTLTKRGEQTFRGILPMLNSTTKGAAILGSPVGATIATSALFAGGNAAWQVAANVFDGNNPLERVGTAFLKGAGLGLSVGVFRHSGYSGWGATAGGAAKAGWGATAKGIAKSLATGTGAAVALGTANVAFDVSPFGSVEWGDTAGMSRSFAQGAIWGIVANYIAANPQHIASIGEKSKRLGMTSKELLAEHQLAGGAGNMLSKLKVLALNDPLLRASASGALNWIVISPLFTAGEAMWTGLATKLTNFINTGTFGTAKWETKEGPLTFDMLARSAIQGPKQGLWMGPMVYLFGKPSGPSSSQAHSGLLSRMNNSYSAAVSAGKALPSRYWLKTAALGSAGWFVGNVEMAGFVTGLHKALSYVQKPEGGEGGISLTGSSAGISELDILGWIGLFIKPHSLSTTRFFAEKPLTPAYDKAVERLRGLEEKSIREGASESDGYWSAWVDSGRSGGKWSEWIDRGRASAPRAESADAKRSSGQWSEWVDSGRSGGQWSEWVDAGSSRSAESAGAGARVSAPLYSRRVEADTMLDLAMNNRADANSRLRAAQHFFGLSVETAKGIDFSKNIMEGKIKDSALLVDAARDYLIKSVVASENTKGKAAYDFFYEVVEGDRGEIGSTKDPSIDVKVDGRTIKIKTSDVLGHDSMYNGGNAFSSTCKALGISREGFNRSLVKAMANELKLIKLREKIGASPDPDGIYMTSEMCNNLIKLMPLSLRAGYNLKAKVEGALNGISEWRQGRKNDSAMLKAKEKIQAEIDYVENTLMDRGVVGKLTRDKVQTQLDALRRASYSDASEADIKAALSIWRSKDMKDIAARAMFSACFDGSPRALKPEFVSNILKSSSGLRDAVIRNIASEKAGIASAASLRAKAAAFLAVEGHTSNGSVIRSVRDILARGKDDIPQLEKDIGTLFDMLKKETDSTIRSEIASKLNFVSAIHGGFVDSKARSFMSTMEGLAFYIFATENALKGTGDSLSSVGRLWQGKGKMDAVLQAMITASLVDSTKRAGIILPGTTLGQYRDNILTKLYLKNNGKLITYDGDAKAFVTHKWDSKKNSIVETERVSQNESGYKEMGKDGALYLISHRDIQFLKLEGHAILDRLDNVCVDEVDAYLNGTAAIIGNPYYSILASGKIQGVFSDLVGRYELIDEMVKRELKASELGEVIKTKNGEVYQDRKIGNEDAFVREGDYRARLKGRRAEDGLEAQKKYNRLLTELSERDEFKGLDRGSISNLIDDCVTVYLYRNGANYYTRNKGEYGIADSDTREMPNTVWGKRSLAIFLGLKHEWGRDVATTQAINYSLSKTNPSDTLKAIKNANIWGCSGTLDGVRLLTEKLKMDVVGIDREPALNDFKGTDKKGKTTIILTDSVYGERSVMDHLTPIIRDAKGSSTRIHAVRYEGIGYGEDVRRAAKDTESAHIDLRFEGEVPRIAIEGKSREIAELDPVNREATAAVKNAIRMALGGFDIVRDGKGFELVVDGKKTRRLTSEEVKDFDNTVESIFKKRSNSGRDVVLGYQGLGPGVNVLTGQVLNKLGIKANVYMLNFNNSSLACQIAARNGTILEGTMYEPVVNAQGKITGYKIGENATLGTRLNGDVHMIVDIARDMKLSEAQANILRDVRRSEGESAMVRRFETMMREGDFKLSSQAYFTAARDTFKMSDKAAQRGYQEMLRNTGVFSSYNRLPGAPITVDRAVTLYDDAFSVDDKNAGENFREFLTSNEVGRLTDESGMLTLQGMLVVRAMLDLDGDAENLAAGDSWTQSVQNNTYTSDETRPGVTAKQSDEITRRRKTVATFLQRNLGKYDTTKSVTETLNQLSNKKRITPVQYAGLIAALDNAGLIDLNNPSILEGQGKSLRGFDNLERMAVSFEGYDIKNLTREEIENCQLLPTESFLWCTPESAILKTMRQKVGFFKQPLVWLTLLEMQWMRIKWTGEKTTKPEKQGVMAGIFTKAGSILKPKSFISEARIEVCANTFKPTNAENAKIATLALITDRFSPKALADGQAYMDNLKKNGINSNAIPALSAVESFADGHMTPEEEKALIEKCNSVPSDRVSQVLTSPVAKVAIWGGALAGLIAGWWGMAAAVTTLGAYKSATLLWSGAKIGDPKRIAGGAIVGGFFGFNLFAGPIPIKSLIGASIAITGVLMVAKSIREKSVKQAITGVALGAGGLMTMVSPTLAIGLTSIITGSILIYEGWQDKSWKTALSGVALAVGGSTLIGLGFVPGISEIGGVVSGALSGVNMAHAAGIAPAIIGTILMVKGIRNRNWKTALTGMALLAGGGALAFGGFGITIPELPAIGSILPNIGLPELPAISSMLPNIEMPDFSWVKDLGYGIAEFASAAASIATGDIKNIASIFSTASGIILLTKGVFQKSKKQIALGVVLCALGAVGFGAIPVDPFATVFEGTASLFSYLGSTAPVVLLGNVSSSIGEFFYSTGASLLNLLTTYMLVGGMIGSTVDRADNMPRNATKIAMALKEDDTSASKSDEMRMAARSAHEKTDDKKKVDFIKQLRRLRKAGLNEEAICTYLDTFGYSKDLVDDNSKHVSDRLKNALLVAMVLDKGVKTVTEEDLIAMAKEIDNELGQDTLRGRINIIGVMRNILDGTGKNVRARDITGTSYENQFNGINSSIDVPTYSNVMAQLPVDQRFAIERLVEAAGGWDEIKSLSMPVLRNLAIYHGVTSENLGVIQMFSNNNILEELGGWKKLRAIANGKNAKEEFTKLVKSVSYIYDSYDRALSNILGSIPYSMNIRDLSDLIQKSEYEGDRFAFVRFVVESGIYRKSMSENQRMAFDDMLTSLGINRNNIPELKGVAHMTPSGETLEEMFLKRAVSTMSEDIDKNDPENIEKDADFKQLAKRLSLFIPFLGPRFSADNILKTGLATLYERKATQLDASSSEQDDSLRATLYRAKAARLRGKKMDISGITAKSARSEARNDFARENTLRAFDWLEISIEQSLGDAEKARRNINEVISELNPYLDLANSSIDPKVRNMARQLYVKAHRQINKVKLDMGFDPDARGAMSRDCTENVGIALDDVSDYARKTTNVDTVLRAETIAAMTEEIMERDLLWAESKNMSGRLFSTGEAIEKFISQNGTNVSLDRALNKLYARAIIAKAADNTGTTSVTHAFSEDRKLAIGIEVENVMDSYPESKHGDPELTRSNLLPTLVAVIGDVNCHNVAAIRRTLQTGDSEGLSSHFTRLLKEDSGVSRRATLLAAELFLDRTKEVERNILKTVAIETLKAEETKKASEQNRSMIMRAHLALADTLAQQGAQIEEGESNTLQDGRMNLRAMYLVSGINALESAALNAEFVALARIETSKIQKDEGIERTISHIEDAKIQKPEVSYELTNILFDIAKELVNENPQEAKRLFEIVLNDFAILGATVTMGEIAVEFAELLEERDGAVSASKLDFLKEIVNKNEICAESIITTLKSRSRNAILEAPEAMNYLSEALEIAHLIEGSVGDKTMPIMDEIVSLSRVCHIKDNHEKLAKNLNTLQETMNGWFRQDLEYITGAIEDAEESRVKINEQIEKVEAEKNALLEQKKALPVLYMADIEGFEKSQARLEKEIARSDRNIQNLIAQRKALLERERAVKEDIINTATKRLEVELQKKVIELGELESGEAHLESAEPLEALKRRKDALEREKERIQNSEPDKVENVEDAEYRRELASLESEIAIVNTVISYNDDTSIEKEELEKERERILASWIMSQKNKNERLKSIKERIKEINEEERIARSKIEGVTSTSELEALLKRLTKRRDDRKRSPSVIDNPEKAARIADLDQEIGDVQKQIDAFDRNPIDEERNAQIHSLRNEIQKLEVKIASVSTLPEVVNNKDVAIIEAKQRDIDTSIVESRTKRDTLEKELTDLKPKSEMTIQPQAVEIEKRIKMLEEERQSLIERRNAFEGRRDELEQERSKIEQATTVGEENYEMFRTKIDSARDILNQNYGEEHFEKAHKLFHQSEELTTLDDSIKRRVTLLMEALEFLRKALTIEGPTSPKRANLIERVNGVLATIEDLTGKHVDNLLKDKKGVEAAAFVDEVLASEAFEEASKAVERPEDFGSRREMVNALKRAKLAQIDVLSKEGKYKEAYDTASKLDVVMIDAGVIGDADVLRATARTKQNLVLREESGKVGFVDLINNTSWFITKRFAAWTAGLTIGGLYTASVVVRVLWPEVPVAIGTLAFAGGAIALGAYIVLSIASIKIMRTYRKTNVKAKEHEEKLSGDRHIGVRNPELETQIAQGNVHKVSKDGKAEQYAYDTSKASLVSQTFRGRGGNNSLANEKGVLAKLGRIRGPDSKVLETAFDKLAGKEEAEKTEDQRLETADGEKTEKTEDQRLETTVEEAERDGAISQAQRTELRKEKEKILAIAREIEILVVRDRYTIHDGGTLAHARRGVTRENDKAIWLGERTLTDRTISDEEVAALLIEEARHILHPDRTHGDKETDIQHDESVFNKLVGIATSAGEPEPKDPCDYDLWAEEDGKKIATAMAEAQVSNDFLNRTAGLQVLGEKIAGLNIASGIARKASEVLDNAKIALEKIGNRYEYVASKEAHDLDMAKAMLKDAGAQENFKSYLIKTGKIDDQRADSLIEELKISEVVGREGREQDTELILSAFFNANIIRSKTGEYVSAQEYVRMDKYAQDLYFGKSVELETTITVLNNEEFTERFGEESAVYLHDEKRVYVNYSQMRSIGYAMLVYFHEIGHYIEDIRSSEEVGDGSVANPLDSQMITEGIAQDFAHTTLMALAEHYGYDDKGRDHGFDLEVAYDFYTLMEEIKNGKEDASYGVGAAVVQAIRGSLGSERFKTEGLPLLYRVELTEMSLARATQIVAISSVTGESIEEVTKKVEYLPEAALHAPKAIHKAEEVSKVEAERLAKSDSILIQDAIENSLENEGVDVSKLPQGELAKAASAMAMGYRAIMREGQELTIIAGGVTYVIEGTEENQEKTVIEAVKAVLASDEEISDEDKDKILEALRSEDGMNGAYEVGYKVVEKDGELRLEISSKSTLDLTKGTRSLTRSFLKDENIVASSHSHIGAIEDKRQVLNDAVASLEIEEVTGKRVAEQILQITDEGILTSVLRRVKPNTFSLTNFEDIVIDERYIVKTETPYGKTIDFRTETGDIRIAEVVARRAVIDMVETDVFDITVTTRSLLLEGEKRVAPLVEEMREGLGRYMLPVEPIMLPGIPPPAGIDALKIGVVRGDYGIVAAPPIGGEASIEKLTEGAYGMALRLKETGVLDGKFGIVFVARNAEFDIDKMAKALDKVRGDPKTSPVQVFFVVNKREDAPQGTIPVVVESGEEMFAAISSELKAHGVKNNSYASIAIAELDILLAEKHLEINEHNENDRFNFMIMGNDEKVREEQAALPALNLINVMIKLVSQEKTTVMALGCNKRSLSILEKLGGMIRLIPITPMEIIRYITEFIFATREAERAF
ncbi:MAG: hypothetical protein ABID09_03785 [Candidatus Omnitrophota bacterium]